MTTIIDVNSYAVGDGVTDDAAAITAAGAAAGINGVLKFGPQPYFIGSTVTLPVGIRTKGCGPNSTYIWRTGDFGDSFKYGSNTSPSTHAGCCEIEGINFAHSSAADYHAGDTTLSNKATSGAHINLCQAQGAIIADVWTSRMPYAVHVDGGANISMYKSIFSGVWDPMNSGCQEGIANIFLDSSNSNPTLITLDEVNLGGPHSASRNYTYSCTDGNVTKTGVQGVGAKYGIFNTGCEGLHVIGGCIGANSQHGVLNWLSAGTANLEQRYVGVFFDGSGGPGCADLYFASFDANTYADNVTISGCTFNGEAYNQYAIFEANGVDGTKKALNNFNITGNTFGYYAGTPIHMIAAQRGVIGPNHYNEYNTLNIGSADSAYVDAVYLGVHTQNILCMGTVANGAHTVRGVEIASGSTGCHASATLLNGTYTA